MSKKGIDHGSRRPLNWQRTKLSEPVEKAQPWKATVDAHARAGTPPTRRGPSALSPNANHPDIVGPGLVLKSDHEEVDYEAVAKARKEALDRAFAKAAKGDFMEEDDMDGSGEDLEEDMMEKGAYRGKGRREGSPGNYKYFYESGAASKPAPQHSHKIPAGALDSKKIKKLGELDKKASDAIYSHGFASEAATPDVRTSNRAITAHFESYSSGFDAARHREVGRALEDHKMEAPGLTKNERFAIQGLANRHREAAEAMDKKAVSDARKKHDNPGMTSEGHHDWSASRASSAKEWVSGLPPERYAKLREAAGMGKSQTAQATDLLKKALGMPQVPMRPEQTQQSQMPQLAQPKIPGMSQMAPPAGMMGQGGPQQQKPIGYTPQGMPIMPDPFAPQHQQFGKPEHMAAAGQQQAQGNPLAANAHQQQAQDSMSPMDRAAEKYGGAPQPQASPAGGRQAMPGMPQPNPAGSGLPQPQPPKPGAGGPPGMGAGPMGAGGPPGMPPKPPMGGQPPGMPPGGGGQAPGMPPGAAGGQPPGMPPGMGAKPPGAPPAAQMQGGMAGKPPMGTPQGQPPMGSQPPAGGPPGAGPDQSKPQGPPQMDGQDRQGPKPGMINMPPQGSMPQQQPMPPAPPMAQPPPEKPPMPGMTPGGPEGGDPIEALLQLLMSAMKPGGGPPAPTPGSNTQQSPQGMPKSDNEKQTGSSAPPTHAAHRGSVEPNAEK